MARLARFELTTFSSVGCRSNPLSYRRLWFLENLIGSIPQKR